MKKLGVFIGILAIFFLTMSNKAFSKSEENKADCERWCNENKPDCVFCDSNAFCGGREHDVIKSFTEGMGNWYACGLSEHERMTRKNRDDCNIFCNDNKPTCQFCKDFQACGPDHTAMKTFGERFQTGDKWYACRWSGDQGNRYSCRTWCDRNKPTCRKCSTDKNCPRASNEEYTYEMMESFKGPGDNWYACKYTPNLDACMNYCDSRPTCGNCLPKERKQPWKKYFQLKGFIEHEGQKWYAYRRKTNNSMCHMWCGEHSGCGRCQYERCEGRVMKKYESYPGDPAYACRERERRGGRRR